MKFLELNGNRFEEDSEHIDKINGIFEERGYGEIDELDELEELDSEEEEDDEDDEGEDDTLEEDLDLTQLEEELAGVSLETKMVTWMKLPKNYPKLILNRAFVKFIEINLD